MKKARAWSIPASDFKAISSLSRSLKYIWFSSKFDCQIVMLNLLFLWVEAQALDCCSTQSPVQCSMQISRSVKILCIFIIYLKGMGQKKKLYCRTQVNLGSDSWVRVSVSESVREVCETLLMWLWLRTIPTQYWLIVPREKFKAMRQCKWCWLIQVAPSGGQICNLCHWCHLVAKFATNESGSIWWPNLQLMQVVPSGGQICY